METIKSIGFADFIEQTLIPEDRVDYVIFRNAHGDRAIEAKDQSFHMIFNKYTGFTAKWGRTFDEDPPYCPFGPEIADIELTKICRGIRDNNGVNHCCPWCYKQAQPSGDYMSFETFKKVFAVITAGGTLTQIAFGTDASLNENSNPDYWKIFDYCKANDVTPNVTVADVSEETAQRMVKTFGACAVSYYPLINKDRCYDSVEKLIRNAKAIGRDMAVNIHCLLADETYNGVLELLDDLKKDKRLEGLNAVVFLSLKQKGRGVHFNKLPYDKFKAIIDRCLKEGISFGMDSCTANKFIKALDELVDEKKKKELMTYIEACEAANYSSYINARGIFYPCSFMECEGEWKEGIDLLKVKDFVKEVWYEPRVVRWRDESIKCIECNGCNRCKFYDV